MFRKNKPFNTDAYLSFFYSPWFSYGFVALLQIKIMFGIWLYRDLTPGDASSYFFKSYSVLDHGRFDLVWAPLYSGLLAIFYALIEDPFWVSVVIQVSIAILVSLLFLALLRQLLPAYVALLVAAWWCLLPINFDTVYNVHLFSAIFPLASFVIIAKRNTMKRRGVVLAVLLLAGLLVRTEYLALCTAWLLIVTVYELLPRQRPSTQQKKEVLWAYGLPLLIVLTVIGVFYARSEVHYTELRDEIDHKSKLYVCQNYAYSQKQMGDPWIGNPWTDCHELIERDFGVTEVSFAHALKLNPVKIQKHVLWNLRLLPSGTQLGLFNAYSGAVNPDYMRAKRADLVWIPFVIVTVLCGLAAIRRFILPIVRSSFGIENGLAWLLMFCSAVFICGIALMVRPRPSYMFPYTLFIMALSGLGLHELLSLKKFPRLVEFLTPVAIIALLLFVPPYYDSNYVSHFGGQGQAWRNTLAMIAPHIDRGESDSPSLMIVPEQKYTSLCNYLGVSCQLHGETNEQQLTGGSRTQGISQANDRNVYTLYLEEMIWQFSTEATSDQSRLSGYVELVCSPPVNNTLLCSDGAIDLNRGVMNDGQTDLPLRSALFVNDGYVVNRKDFPYENGYYLQVIMVSRQIYMILVADKDLFRSTFNQQFLLGNFSPNIMEEIYNQSPMIRIFRHKDL